MSNKLYILFSGALVSVTMIGLFVLTSKLQNDKQQITAQPSPVLSQQKRIQAPTSKISTQDQALTILNMWYNLTQEDGTNGIRLDHRIQNAQKIGIRSEMLSAMQVGYNIELPDLDGNRYLMKLAKVESDARSEVQIFGEINQNDVTYFSTISIKDNTILGVLSTPNGGYDMKMVDGKGYVYKSFDQEESQQTADAVIDLEGFLD